MRYARHPQDPYGANGMVRRLDIIRPLTDHVIHYGGGFLYKSEQPDALLRELALHLLGPDACLDLADVRLLKE